MLFIIYLVIEKCVEGWESMSWASIIGYGVTLVAAVLPLIFSYDGKNKGISKAQSILSLFRERNELLHRDAKLDSIPDKALEEQEMLHRQVAEETARAIAQACTPILSPMSAFLGKSLSVVCFISSFYLIFCTAVPLLIDYRDWTSAIWVQEATLLLLACMFLLSAVRFQRMVSRSAKSSIQLDAKGTFCTIRWDPIEQTTLGIQSIIYPVISVIAALFAFLTYFYVLKIIVTEDSEVAAVALFLQNSPYGVVFFAVLFVIVITLYAVVQNKKSASTCNKESALTFDGADQILSWQQTECMVDPFRYALRTKSNKSWFDFLFDEICASGSHDTACSKLYRNGYEYWVVGDDRRMIRKRPLV